MKRRLAALVALVLVWSIADNLLRDQHPCTQCGASMQQHEQGSPIYRCSKCGHMLNAEYTVPDQH